MKKLNKKMREFYESVQSGTAFNSSGILSKYGFEVEKVVTSDYELLLIRVLPANSVEFKMGINVMSVYALKALCRLVGSSCFQIDFVQSRLRFYPPGY